MSKRYPVLRRWMEGIPMNKPNRRDWFVDYFYGKLGESKWLHVNTDVFSIAKKEVDRFLHLELDYLEDPIILTFNLKDDFLQKAVFLFTGMSRKQVEGGGYITSIRFCAFLNIGSKEEVISGGFAGGTTYGDDSISIDSDFFSGNLLTKEEKAIVNNFVKASISTILFVYNILPQKIEKASLKKKRGIICKYEKLNDLPIPVDFINLGRLSGQSKGKPFSVAGHPRLQRVGKGLKKVKVVWVKPHVKGGRSTKPYKETLMTDN